MKKKIYSHDAPQAIGPYSQAIQVGNIIYFSGQIPLDPRTNQIVSTDFSSQTKQVFENIKTIAESAGGQLKNIIKLTIFVTDLINFSVVNDVMKHYFDEPYPARSTVQVSALPKEALIEVEAIMTV